MTFSLPEPSCALRVCSGQLVLWGRKAGPLEPQLGGVTLAHQDTELSLPEHRGLGCPLASCPRSLCQAVSLGEDGERVSSHYCRGLLVCPLAGSATGLVLVRLAQPRRGLSLLGCQLLLGGGLGNACL